MDYESYMTLCYVTAGACVAFFAITVFLFFKLKIRSVIGDISGATAKKAIENIRNQNAQTKNKAHRSSPVNQARGKITDKITPSGKLLSATSGGIYVNVGTEQIESVQEKGNEESDATTLLRAQTNRLKNREEQFDYSEETTVLESVDAFIQIEEEITFVSSEEEI